jgi:hypothetical protein
LDPSSWIPGQGMTEIRRATRCSVFRHMLTGRWMFVITNDGNSLTQDALDPAAVSMKLSDRCFLKLIDGTVNSGHPIGNVKDVTQVTWLVV